MPQNKTEEEFIKGLKSEDTAVIDDSLILGSDTIKTEPEPAKAEDDESPRNRRERRFVREMEEVRRQAQEDREARIKAEERASALLELGKRADASTDPDEMKFYGDTPEGKFAKAFMDKKLTQVKEQTRSEILEEIRQKQEDIKAEEQKDSQTIDSGLRTVEEEFDVDLSGSTPESKKLRNGYIDFLESLTTDSFPDFVKSFEVYKELHTKPREVSQRQKVLADRSMASSGSTGTAQERKFRSGREFIDYLQNING